MIKLYISKSQARAFMLAHQGLLKGMGFKGEQGVLDYIKRVGSIQFDPLNIVGRNPELVLQSRVDGFKPEMLNELLYKDRRLVDGFDKVMCIYGIEDWPRFKRYRDADYRRYHKEGSKIVEVLPKLRELIAERGPVSSLDVELDEMVDWAWAPARLSRAALEAMYFWGELIIHHKINTRRIYDFTYKHLPAELLDAPDPNITEEEYQDWHVLRRIGSVGLLWAKAGDAWIFIKGVKSKERNEAIKRLLESQKLVEVCVEGVKYPFYSRRADIERIDIKAAENAAANPKAAIIAPLDNLMWDRKLIAELFEFDYRWEVYKPAEQRDYGYYVLPVLCGDRFVARFEPGRDKETGALIIKNWWWEEGIKQSQKLDKAVVKCFRSFLKYLGAGSIIVDEKANAKLDISKIIDDFI